MLDHVFEKAESGFYDYPLNAVVLGMLVLLRTGTEDEDVKDIADKVCKLCPKVVRAVMDILPKDIHNPHLKEYVEGLL